MSSEAPSLSARVRSAVPARLVPSVVEARTWARRQQEGWLEQARREMEFLVGSIDPGAVEAAAHRYLRRDVMRSELRYHPELIVRQPVVNAGALTRARRAGRGVVVSFLHHGHYEGAMAALATADAPFMCVAASLTSAPDAPAFLRQNARVYSWTGNAVVDVGEGSARLAARLREAQVLALATDIPGSSEVGFLGRRRLGSAGAARLAHQTNSLVVPLHSHCESDGRLWLSLSDPVEPRDFTGVAPLLQHLVSAQEPSVQAWPEGYYQPTKRWGVPTAESARTVGKTQRGAA